MLRPEERRDKEIREQILSALRSLVADQARLASSLEDLSNQFKENQKSKQHQSASGNNVQDNEQPVFHIEAQIPETLITEHRTNQNQASTINRWMLAVSILTFVVLVIYACFTYGQWQAMLGQWESMDISIAQNRLAYKIGVQQAEAAKSAATTAELTLKQSKIDGAAQEKRNRQAMEASERQSGAALNASIEASRNDQRAWVGVRGFELIGTVAPGQPMHLNINYFNTGKTPALHVIFTNCGTGDTEEATLRFECPPSDYGVAAPNTEMHAAFISDPVTQVYIDRLRAHTIKTYYRGVLTYEDISGVIRHTGFCASFDGAGFLECPHGNYMD